MKNILWFSLGFALLTSCIEKTSISGDNEADMEMSAMTCLTHSDCQIGEYCNECARSSCPVCEDCVGECQEITCDGEEVLECDLERPACEEGQVSIIKEGCWVCVNRLTCEPSLTESLNPSCESTSDCPAGSYCAECAGASCPSCDDCIPGCLSICESEITAECDLERPTCTDREVSIIRDGCWVCVDRLTCEPSFTAVSSDCSSNQDCSLGQYCNQCAAASCPSCTDCIALCQNSPCETEPEATCRSLPPECVDGQVLVVREGCWLCVDQLTCEPSQVEQTMCTINSECEVGSYCDECATSSCPSCPDCIGLCTESTCESEDEVVCEIESPSCESGTVLIIRDGCWLCVGRESCEAMSMEPPLIDCNTASDCSFGSICDPCAGSSCPECDDCISACRPVCESEQEVLCNTARPECENSQVLVVRDNCWLCVDQISCEP